MDNAKNDLDLIGEVPVVAGAPARFGPSNVLRALQASRTGEIISLNLDLDDPGAPFGRSPFKRTMRLHNQLRPLDGDRYMVINDDEVFFNLQGSSQWDAFAHFGVIEPGRKGVYYGDAELSETFPKPSAANLGIQALGPGIVSRGVLLDAVAEFGAGQPFLPGGFPIDRQMVEQCIESQQVRIEPGDAVLIYTGMERRRAAADGAWPTDSAGLTADTVSLWEELQIIALISDNLGIDVTPGKNPVHVGLLRELGIPLGELWALDHLAQRCRHDARWDFLLVAVPLNISGAFGSPANAIAVW
jgi:kynurenine formamidase